MVTTPIKAGCPGWDEARSVGAVVGAPVSRNSLDLVVFCGDSMLFIAAWVSTADIVCLFTAAPWTVAFGAYIGSHWITRSRFTPRWQKIYVVVLVLFLFVLVRRLVFFYHNLSGSLVSIGFCVPSVAIILVFFTLVIYHAFAVLQFG